MSKARFVVSIDRQTMMQGHPVIFYCQEVQEGENKPRSVQGAMFYSMEPCTLDEIAQIFEAYAAKFRELAFNEEMADVKGETSLFVAEGNESVN